MVEQCSMCIRIFNSFVIEGFGFAVVALYIARLVCDKGVFAL